MYVFIQSDSLDYEMRCYHGRCHGPVWTVGYYQPDGTWVPESDHTTKISAAQRVYNLNGGSGTLVLL